MEANNILPFRKYDILSEEEKSNDFFKKLDLGFICPNKISKEQSFFVQMYDVGSWLVYRCLNCLMYTHATNPVKNEQQMVVNRSLLPMSKVELSIIQKSDEYSSIFHVMISDLDDCGNEVLISINDFDLYGKAVLALEHKLNENIRQKEQETEEKIRQFSEKQCSTLNEYKEHAHKEFKALARLLIMRDEQVRKCKSQVNKHENVSNDNNNNNNKVSKLTEEVVSNTTLNLNTKIDIIDKTRIKDSQVSPLSDSELEFSHNIPASYDCEGLFPLDGMETPPEEEDHSEEDLTDTDDSGSHDEGIHIPRRKSNAIARSLPIRVPIDFDPSFQWFDENKSRPNFKRERHERPMDIAASIKALANSVHGEALFGDLPPPRIGSKI